MKQGERIRKLDLGGTACYVDPNAISISLDGSNSEDPVTPLIVGDYNRAPFPDEAFNEAFGSCALEDDIDFRELYRIMKHGSRTTVTACGEFYLTGIRDPDDERGLNDTFEEFIQFVSETSIAAAAAGFRVIVEERETFRNFSEEPTAWTIYTPMFRLYKD